MPALTAAAAEGQELTGLAGFVVDVVATLGPAGVALLVLLENLFPPVPSEVVLPLAGFLAGQGRMSFVAVLVAATLGSVVGAVLLYYLGATLGRERLRPLLDKAPLMGADDLDRAEDWFSRHGGTAVLVGRLVPGMRSLVSVPAGVDRMPLPQFVAYTTLGSGAYNTALVLLGQQLGQRWTNVGQYSDLLSAAVIGGLVLALAILLLRRYRRRRA